jgi:hypothetical protein
LLKTVFLTIEKRILQVVYSVIWLHPTPLFRGWSGRYAHAKHLNFTLYTKNHFCIFLEILYQDLPKSIGTIYTLQ